MRDRDEPRDVLGEAIWEALEPLEEAPLPASFDAGFEAKRRRARFRVVGGRGWLPAVGAVAALAAAMLLTVRLTAPGAPPEDLQLAAELELVENLDVLEDLDVLLAWDGQAP